MKSAAWGINNAPVQLRSIDSSDIHSPRPTRTIAIQQQIAKQIRKKSLGETLHVSMRMCKRKDVLGRGTAGMQISQVHPLTSTPSILYLWVESL